MKAGLTVVALMLELLLLLLLILWRDELTSNDARRSQLLMTRLVELIVVCC